MPTRDAGSAALDEEALHLPLLDVAGPNHGDVGERRVADPLLLPVEDPYVEARAARECLGSCSGVVAIPKLAPFDYLLLRADDTARRVVDPDLLALIEDDRERGGVLSETVQAFAGADLNLRLAAARLHVHANTGQYRLRRAEDKTGRNPRRIADLLGLLVAIALAGSHGIVTT